MRSIIVGLIALSLSIILYNKYDKRGYRSLSYMWKGQIGAWGDVSSDHYLNVDGTAMYVGDSLRNTDGDMVGGIDGLKKEFREAADAKRVPKVIHLVMSGDGHLDDDGKWNLYKPEDNALMDCFLESLINKHIVDTEDLPDMYIMLTYRYYNDLSPILSHFSDYIYNLMSEHSERIVFNLIYDDQAYINSVAKLNPDYKNLTSFLSDTLTSMTGDGSLLSDVIRLLVLRLYGGIYTDTDRLWHKHVLTYQSLFEPEKQVDMLGQQAFLTDFTYSQEILNSVMNGTDAMSGKPDDMCDTFRVGGGEIEDSMLKHLNNDLMFIVAGGPSEPYAYNSRCTDNKLIKVATYSKVEYYNVMDMFPNFIAAIPQLLVSQSGVSSKNFRFLGPLYITHWIKYNISPMLIIPDIYYNSFQWNAFRNPVTAVKKMKPDIRKMLNDRIAVHYTRSLRLTAAEHSYDEDSFIGATLREDCPIHADQVRQKGFSQQWVYGWQAKERAEEKKGLRGSTIGVDVPNLQQEKEVARGTGAVAKEVVVITEPDAGDPVQRDDGSKVDKS